MIFSSLISLPPTQSQTCRSASFSWSLFVCLLITMKEKPLLYSAIHSGLNTNQTTRGHSNEDDKNLSDKFVVKLDDKNTKFRITKKKLLPIWLNFWDLLEIPIGNIATGGARGRPAGRAARLGSAVARSVNNAVCCPFVYGRTYGNGNRVTFLVNTTEVGEGEGKM